MALVTTVDPTEEPITRAEAKLHLKVDTTADDALIDALIVAARRALEAHTARAFITQTMRQSHETFPVVIYAERNRLIAVSSIVYTDTNGDSQTLAASAYTVDTDSVPGRVVPIFNTTWPLTRRVPNALQITYTAGYGPAASDVPQEIKQAMYLAIGLMYANRSGEDADYLVRSNGAVYNLILPHIVFAGLLV